MIAYFRAFGKPNILVDLTQTFFSPPPLTDFLRSEWIVVLKNLQKPANWQQIPNQ